MKLLSSIILISAAASAGTSLAPQGKTKKTVFFAVSLVTLLSLVSPILSALSDGGILPDGFSLPDAPDAAPSEIVTNAAATALAKEIEDRFGVAPNSVAVSLPSDGVPGKISVTLPGDAEGLDNKIAAWIRANVGADVSVAVGTVGKGAR